MTTPVEELDIITAQRYGERGYPHEEWTRLRREAPICKMQPENYTPFWAVTKHADIIEVSKQPDLFKSDGRFILLPELLNPAGETLAENPPLRMLVNMDPPEHRDYRALISDWFNPRAVSRLESRLEEITNELFDDIACSGRAEFDFVNDIAVVQPLRMITEMLGIPREKEGFVIKVTNENFGLEDPEFQREGNTREERLGFLTEAFTFVTGLMEERREDPREDLTTVFAHAQLNGADPPIFELLSNYFLVMVAGHDTTRNAISGGLLALLDHPGELAKLRADPSLSEIAAEEIVRWVTPVNHFSRTATRDTVLRGVEIEEGDSVALFYASANRDEDVYDDPFVFRIDRDPNPHLGFGIGEHFCLGAHLARLDLKVFFRVLAERVESMELCGPVENLHASFVPGPKRIPLRMTLKS